MQITVNYINEILINEDIEGFIELGAPNDEYLAEAEQIFDSINKLGDNEISEEILLSITSIIWMKNFELNQNEMESRIPAIKNIVNQLIVEIGNK